MNRLLLTSGIICAVWSPAALQAQDNGTFDDVYYTGSQARKDAKNTAKQADVARSEAEYYNSSAAYGNSQEDFYSSDYSGSYDSYIDYDDDSYTTRMRRFHHPMSGSGYWGSIYSPYWMDPFYSPMGWGYPGIRFSMSFGYGSYWGGGYPYGGFYNSWGYPSYGWGYPMYGYGMGGYYSGFWNGYYNGFYDGGYFNNHRYRNYGPRGARSPLYSGNTGRQSQRVNPINRRLNTDPRGEERRGSALNQRMPQGNRTVERSTDRRIQVERPARVINNNNDLRVNKEQMRVQSGQQQIRAERPANNRNSGIFNRRQTPQRSTPQRTYEAPATNRSYQAPARQQRPSVSPSRSAPSRSFSAPSSGSRSSGSSGASRGGGRR